MQHVPLSHFTVTLWCLPFYYNPFPENDLCFKLSVLVSEEGALHNRQIWPEASRAAKLSVLSLQITMRWNNLVFCLRRSSFPPCLFIYHFLNWPMNVLDLKKNNFWFILPLFYLIIVLRLDPPPVPSALYLCFLSLQPRSILDPKVLGLQTGGWVAALFTAKTLHSCASI